MTKECPNCRTVNPAEAKQCNCGFDFLSHPSLAPRADPHPRLTRLATIETWLAVMIAFIVLGYAFVPARPMVGLPVEEFTGLILPLPPLSIGIGLAFGGIRFGRGQVRVLATMTLLFLVFLLVAWTLVLLNKYRIV
jgi:hypothetical protein